MNDERKKKMDKVFIRIAIELSTLSRCQSMKVGAILVKDGRIISTGVNGSPSGQENCDEIFPPKNDPSFDREKHHNWSLLNEIHAEQNMIARAAEVGASTAGATLYSTLQPCNACSKLLVAAGIKRVVYIEEYDKTIGNNEVLCKSSIVTEKIEG